MTSRVNGPITVAIVDDYDVVVMGSANMFDQYSDRVVVAEFDSNEALVDTVDIALYVFFCPAGIGSRRDCRSCRQSARPTSCGLHLELSPGPRP